MPRQRRQKLIPSRRRHDDDEGEEEGSVAGDIETTSFSDGSAPTIDDEDADVEVSDASEKDEGRQQQQRFSHSADTQAMLNGLQADPGKLEELQFDGNRAKDVENLAGHVSSSPNRNRRERVEAAPRRNSNPAFVPNRGGFFLHDDRSREQTGAHQGFQRGRGRGYNPGYGRGFSTAYPQATDRQWAHDLHEAVNKSDFSGAVYPTTNQAAKPANTPNRSFSTTTVLGRITVQVCMPGMDGKKTFPNVVKKHYTLLPQHRPPLRRDKPVRISIPDEHPRYIFPSTERSFIFIPRALRPNQQVFRGGRGRGSWHGSRRTSIYGGSVNSPSIAMSRKSSIGASASGSGVQTPTGMSNMPQFFGRPIVRMPAVTPVQMGPMMPQFPIRNDYGHFPETTPIMQSPPVALPMHQPRPQKAVSIADIESPTVKAPRQQTEQPFHQQVPPFTGYEAQQSQGKGSQGTPLAHIPEGAVYAQPFQPYPMMPQMGYYGMPYSNGAMYMPPHSDGINYGMHMGGPVNPNVLPPGYSMGYSDNSQQAPVPMMQESHGMIYYYDQSNGNQYPMNAAGGGMMGNMQPNPFFYSSVPNAMFYNQQQSGQ